MKARYFALPLLALSHGAYAQAAPQETSPSADATTSAETANDIIVIAQKRAQNVQDVPLTVSVIGAQEIEQARIERVGDIANRTPGLNFDVSMCIAGGMGAAGLFEIC